MKFMQSAWCSVGTQKMFFPFHSLPLLSDFLPSFSFSSVPLQWDIELWSIKEGTGKQKTCKQSLGSNKRDACLSHRGWKESKVPPQKSLEARFSPFAGWFMILWQFQVIVNWPFSLQSTFTYLIAFDLHNNCRAAFIFLLSQMSQVKLTMVKKWTHKPKVRGKVWFWAQMISRLC